VTELWSNRQFATTYSWIQNILRSIVPLLIISTLNCFIVDALRRSARHVSSSSSGNQAIRHNLQLHHHQSIGRRVSPRNRRVTLMLVAVIVVFIVCVTPDAVMSTVFGFGYYDESSDLIRGIREITDFLLLVNSATNFMLYCAFNSVFRHHFRSLVVRQFQKCCCCGRQLLCRSWSESIRTSVVPSEGRQPTFKSSPSRLPMSRLNIQALTPVEPAIREESTQDRERAASYADRTSNGHANSSNAEVAASATGRRSLKTPSASDVERSVSPSKVSAKNAVDVAEVKPVVVDIHISDSWDCLTIM